MTHKTLSFHDLHLTPRKVYLQMGYGDSLPDSRVAEEVADVMAMAEEVARPRFCYHVMNGTLHERPPRLAVGDKGASLADDFSGGHKTRPYDFGGQACLAVGATIARQLTGSESFAIFVATAGMEYEQLRKQESDPLRVFVADAVGSVMVERCADLMENAIQASIDKLGWHHTNRFSPGYCGWNVADQQQLFPLLGNAPCGVTLTDGQMMVPVKSVSGVIGLGPTVTKLPYPCSLCNNKGCFKRKE